MTVNILGSEYTIEFHDFKEDKILCDNDFCGYCVRNIPLIVIADPNTIGTNFLNEEAKQNHAKESLRHEIVHAFFYESGLKASSGIHPHGWSENEELVDWIALQGPKIYKAWQEANAL